MRGRALADDPQGPKLPSRLSLQMQPPVTAARAAARVSAAIAAAPARAAVAFSTLISALAATAFTATAFTVATLAAHGRVVGRATRVTYPVM